MVSQMLSNTVTFLFCGSIVYLMLRYRNHPRLAAELPTLVTSIGVMGTFVGIFLGLLEFDPRKLEASVPALLEGLKTAFITSIFGMGAAFILKIRGSILEAVDDGAPQHTGATVDTLAEILERMDRNNLVAAKELTSRLQGVESAIVGDGETTIHTQIIKMRTSIADKQDELIKEFKSFAVQMAENNSKAFIKALEEVIRDFNTKITEQFGDNFKQLNQAVGQLLVWQENYRSQVEQMVSQLRESAKTMESAGASMTVIADKSQSLVKAAENLEELLKELNAAKKETERNLKTFAEVSREAKTLLPRVEKFMVEATQDVSKVVKTATDANQKLLETHAASIQEVAEQLSKSVSENARSVKAQSESIAAQRKQLDDMLTKASNEVGRIWQAATAANQKLLDTHTTAMKDRFEAFDDSMNKELKKAIETLGGQLAALSAKFVDDYTPLTENLRDVVKIAKDIRR